MSFAASGWSLLPWVAGWPLLLRAAVLPVVLLSLMTYVVMPWLTRLFRGWLYPSPLGQADKGA